MSSRLYLEHLAPSELTSLMQYKYKGEDRSIMYKYVLGPFYSRLIDYFPLWIAPNTITLIGFILTVASHLVLMYHAPHLIEEAPRGVYLITGVTLFIYMVLDNIDGKQARRTGSSSPLGQLFDHGCDALNVTLSGMTMLATLQLGASRMSVFMLFFLGQMAVFGATLEEYHTGVMILRELNGPNEGLIFICLLQICTGIVGPGLWTSVLRTPWGLVQANHAMFYFGLLPSVSSVLGNLMGIGRHYGQWGPRGAGWREILRQCLGIGIYGACLNLWPVLAPLHFERQVVLIMWLSGGVVFDLISRMMLAHLAGAAFPYCPVLVAPVVMCFANAVLAEKGLPVIGADWLTLLVVGGTGAFNLWRCWCLVSQLCDFLNVKCFSLGPLAENKTEKKAAENKSE